MKYAPPGGWTPGGSRDSGVVLGEGASGGTPHAAERRELEDQTWIDRDIYRASPRDMAVKGGPAKDTLDRSKVARAQEILDDLDLDDEAAMPVQLADLAGTLCELWETACQADHWHAGILALAEGAASSWKRVDSAQADVLKESLAYLSNDVLTDTIVEVIRNRFVRAGYNPLAFLGGFENSHGDGANE